MLYVFEFGLRAMSIFVGVKMIVESRKDLVNRREFYYLVKKKMNEKEGNANLHSTLTMQEILEIFQELPSQDELWADWELEDGKWHCSWCLMPALRDRLNQVQLSRYCPSCGWHMRVKE